MSTYQTYEFQAIDHILDDQAQDALRNISSRATITPTSFTNTDAQPLKSLRRRNFARGNGEPSPPPGIVVHPIG